MVAAVESRLQRQKLVEGHTQRVDVGPLVDDPAPGLGLLGAHVPERADHVAGVRQAEIAGESRQAEIGDPECTVGIDQEVGRLDVAMDDTQAMGVVERIGGLGTQPGDIAAKGPILVHRPDRRRSPGDSLLPPVPGSGNQHRVRGSRHPSRSAGISTRTRLWHTRRSRAGVFGVGRKAVAITSVGSKADADDAHPPSRA